MKSILVTYASQHGSTAEVARAIGERLRQRGETVDVRSVADVADLSPYQAVVIGSGVIGGRWQPPAVSFVRQHAEALKRLPVAIFSLHLMSRGDNWIGRKRRAAYVAPVRALITPQEQGFFAGKSPDGQPDGAAVRLFAKVFGVGSGDLRDWQAIRAWADGLFAG
ncbi:MAG: flavodoxin domain-containing protein [Anaerolineae bacterium]